MTVFFIGKSNEEIKVDLSTTPRNATSGAGGLDDQVYQRFTKRANYFPWFSCGRFNGKCNLRTLRADVAPCC